VKIGRGQAELRNQRAARRQSTTMHNDPESAAGSDEERREDSPSEPGLTPDAPHEGASREGASGEGAPQERALSSDVGWREALSELGVDVDHERTWQSERPASKSERNVREAGDPASSGSSLARRSGRDAGGAGWKNGRSGWARPRCRSRSCTSFSTRPTWSASWTRMAICVSSRTAAHASSSRCTSRTSSCATWPSTSSATRRRVRQTALRQRAQRRHRLHPLLA
jgi:hypothetical protein